VRGEAIIDSPENVLKNNPDFLKKFDLIILNETTEVRPV